jgi:hypothetical protein
MPILLLDDSLSVDVFYDQFDCAFDDNICVSLIEDCPEEEKIFRVEETDIYLTPTQARDLAGALLRAAEASEKACGGVGPE